MKVFEYTNDFVSILSIGIALRAIVGLHGYSGKGKSPMFGDYEAQRHWQEITVNLEALEWYINSTNNDLLYWGIDYPPLTAYHSNILGRAARLIDEKYVKLQDSRGFESKNHKAFMRFSVLIADLLIYLPAITILGFSLQETFNKPVAASFIFLLMIYPGQVLIDNGHFQYNNISLGLAALAVAGILKNNDYVAAFFFSLAINYKQMELYHALPLFFMLLRSCVVEPKSIRLKLHKFGVIACIVLSSFILIWLPWLRKTETALSVLKRLFPIGRGVFEDKVANFWCALNVGYKIKNLFSNAEMAAICLFTTAAVAFPVNVHLLCSRRKDTFLWAMTNTALAFFLFSYQVHEKSILLAVLPASCLMAIETSFSIHLLNIAAFSMVPLFVKDELALAFYPLILIFHMFVRAKFPKNQAKYVNTLNSLSVSFMLFCSIVLCTTPSPSRYPHLWPLFISLFCFLNFIFCFTFGVFKQFNQ